MIWEFPDLTKSAAPLVFLILDDEGLVASAEDDHYTGRVTKETALVIARAIIAEFAPGESQTVGKFARVVDGAMCGSEGFVVGHVQETGDVILRCIGQRGLLIQPVKFVEVVP